LFQLAEQLHMPVGELMVTMSSVEIRAWAKYYEHKADLAKRKQR
jgi:hypothetical protein